MTFSVLAAAFAISALYQLYRAALMEVPEYDAFTPATGVAYLAFIGISALVLTDRRWAWWVVSALVLALGVLWYYPVVAAAMEMGFVDWLEGSFYVGLIFVAGFVWTLKLLGARLLLEMGQRGARKRDEKQLAIDQERSENPATGSRLYYHPDQKDYATVLKTSEQTDGEYTLVKVEVAPDGGTPPHYHKTYEERFEILEGALEVTTASETHTLRSGEKATVPLNTLHNFYNPTQATTIFLVELRPGSAGFEKALKAGYGLESDGRSSHHPYQLAVLLGWSDMRLPGFFTAVEPLLRMLERRARRKGIDRELEARYCR